MIANPDVGVLPLRILLLEGCDGDAQLIQGQLATFREPWTLERVDRRETYVKALREQIFDAILADYTLKGFDGLAALKLARELQPATPVICLSAIRGEQFAIDALKAGATDYVLKHLLGGLPEAIERALEVARQRIEPIAETRPARAETEAPRLGMWAFYPGTTEAWWDRQCRELYDLAPDAPVAMTTFLDAIHPDDVPRVSRTLERATSIMGPEEFAEDYRILAPQGGERWLHLHGRRFVGTGGLTRFLGVMLDTTERRATADALVRANETLAAVIEKRTQERDRTWQLSRDLMLVGPFDRPPLAINPAWTETLGWSPQELMRDAILKRVHPDDRQHAGREAAWTEQGRPASLFEVRMCHKNGSFRTIAWSVVNADETLYAVGRDVTEERLAQAQLRQAQKMETIGQLTGGVAHDFNNLLTVIAGNLEIVQRLAVDLPSETGGRIRHAAANAIRGADRAASLTQRLLAFARRQPLEPRPVDINKLIEDMSDLLGRTLGEHLTIKTRLDPALWEGHIDPNQLEIAVLNLAVNARDAMGPAGELTVETANVHLDDTATLENDLVPGDYIVIVTSDTGSGMSETVLGQVFEPFFTTKDIGQGTGLGLSQVYGFVKQSGGHVKIRSRPNHGTTVKLYLPRHRPAMDRDE